MTASPLGSTRTTSKAGVDAGDGAAAAVGLAALGSAVGAAAGEFGAGAGAVGAEATEAGGAPRG
jgi:hypothetical protein